MPLHRPLAHGARKALRAGIALLAAGMLAPWPAAAQKVHLAYSEDCSGANSPLVQESCSGKRETQLRERLRRVGLQAVPAPEQAQVHLGVAIDIRLAAREPERHV